MGFTETVELLLVRMYDLGSQGDGAEFDLVETAKALGATDAIAWQAIEALKRRGLVDCVEHFGNECSGQISAEGRLFVEGGGKTGVISRYRQNPGAFVYVSNSPGAAVNTGHFTGVQAAGSSMVHNTTAGPDWATARVAVEALLQKLSALPITAEIKEEVHGDLAGCSAQLAKREPKLSIVRDSLESAKTSLQILATAGGVVHFVQQIQDVLAMLLQ